MITFETKCYEKDWKLLLTTPYLRCQIERCNIAFAQRQLIINNVNDETLVRRYADKAVAKGIIDSYRCVSDYSEEVLDFFGISFESFRGGYPYSISELTGIYLCKTPYLIHFASDTIMDKNGSSWISDAMELMVRRDDISAANPVWNGRYSEAETEATDSDDKWYYSQGFSDQCYLIKTDEFRNRIYGYSHPVSDRYPAYGGELFEKRVDAYLRSCGKRRITAKSASYIHRNIPKNALKRFLYIQKWKLNDEKWQK